MTTTTFVEERGQTTISERTVERIAATALTEVGGVGGSARRVLGVAVTGEDLGRPPHVSAQIRGEAARLDVRLSVTYPASVRATTEAARRHLVHRLGELTGLAVSRVDITVTALHSDTGSRRRVQ
ncbi:Asp23/Gls24 family envelope stress response protein [Amycolatopsis thermoflava]|uniref:Asp23/Gls24 family envelope stress response protein n=1 Tax=Amycolatopsis thermoflava TaxID=84480 RepID=UPI0004182D86|nr:Asp23/Gls24 family envelope stress response protein [Amycolatopsis thermoflava]